MIKYLPEMTSVVMEEIPDEVTLAVEISNCQGNCIGCHSPFLKTDIGEELTPDAVDRMISDNFGINCFLLLGEGRDRDALLGIGSYIRSRYPSIRSALYSGRTSVEEDIFETFDYVKVGPYMEKYGPLNSRTTNQRLYKVRKDADGSLVKEDITSRFWKRGLESSRKD